MYVCIRILTFVCRNGSCVMRLYATTVRTPLRHAIKYGMYIYACVCYIIHVFMCYDCSYIYVYVFVYVCICIFAHTYMHIDMFVCSECKDFTTTCMIIHTIYTHTHTNNAHTERYSTPSIGYGCMDNTHTHIYIYI